MDGLLLAINKEPCLLLTAQNVDGLCFDPLENSYRSSVVISRAVHFCVHLARRSVCLSTGTTLKAGPITEENVSQCLNSQHFCNL